MGRIATQRTASSSPASTPAASMPAAATPTTSAPTQMIDLDKLDDLARRLSGLVPPAMSEGREELQQNFKAVLQAGLGKLDLVTREEFEVQRAVLLRTREKLEALEALLATLEAQLGAAAANDAPRP